MHNPLGRRFHPCRHVQTKTPHLLAATHRPEFDEILQHGGGDEQAVEQRVGQEEDEKLVVGESHTVVHPGDRTVMLRRWSSVAIGTVRRKNV